MSAKPIYRPPYTITQEILNRVAVISEAVGRLTAFTDPSRALRLRRGNRIRTIHGSLAIEGNTLSEAQITAILEGKRVIAPPREVQEVKNALAAYERFDVWRPEVEQDLLDAHRILMAGLIDEAGLYRCGGVEVMAGQQLIHMAPPAHRLPQLMGDLFRWLAGTDAHPLIASSVFHYEFEFIHPFTDGNGRMGRLWQSLILAPHEACADRSNLIYLDRHERTRGHCQIERLRLEAGSHLRQPPCHGKGRRCGSCPRPWQARPRPWLVGRHSTPNWRSSAVTERTHMDIRYPMILEPQDPKGFFVRFADLDDTFTEGETEEEALFNAAEVLSGMLEWRIDHDLPIPEPSPAVAGAHYVAPDARIQAALLMRRMRGNRPLSEIARAMGTSWPSAKRLEDVRHWPTLKQLEKAAAVLGHRLIISFE